MSQSFGGTSSTFEQVALENAQILVRFGVTAT